MYERTTDVQMRCHVHRGSESVDYYLKTSRGLLAICWRLILGTASLDFVLRKTPTKKQVLVFECFVLHPSLQWTQQKVVWGIGQSIQLKLYSSLPYNYSIYNLFLSTFPQFSFWAYRNSAKAHRSFYYYLVFYRMRGVRL